MGKRGEEESWCVTSTLDMEQETIQKFDLNGNQYHVEEKMEQKNVNASPSYIVGMENYAMRCGWISSLE